MKRTLAGLVALALVFSLSAPALAAGTAPPSTPSTAPVDATNGTGTVADGTANLTANGNNGGNASNTGSAPITTLPVKDSGGTNGSATPSTPGTPGGTTTTQPIPSWTTWPWGSSGSQDLVVIEQPGTGGTSGTTTPGTDGTHTGYTLSSAFDSGNWKQVQQVLWWQWDFNNAANGKAWTRQTPTREIHEPVTDVGSYKVVATPWVIWAYGHYVTRAYSKTSTDANNTGDLGRIVETYRVKDGERQDWDYSQQATFRFTLSTAEVPGTVDLPITEHQVTAIDELVK